MSSTQSDPCAPIRLEADRPALILAPMEGLTDAPMRAVQGEAQAFTFAVSEFFRITTDLPGTRVFRRHVPELQTGGRTLTGMPVQLQLLGGDAEKMGQAAALAVEAGVTAVDINFGCPAPTVNRHDGGATLLKSPCRVRDIVAAVRAAVPPEIPVSAKLRLGWDRIETIFETSEMAAEGGAAWLTIHGRTRVAGYRPPAYWGPIGIVRERLGIPVVANGDIFTVEAFRRCRDETGCIHFMLGRGALADPRLSRRIAAELGLIARDPADFGGEGQSASAGFDHEPIDWPWHLSRLVHHTARLEGNAGARTLCRLKQWLKIAEVNGDFDRFDEIKRSESIDQLMDIISRPCCATLSR